MKKKNDKKDKIIEEIGKLCSKGYSYIDISIFLAIYDILSMMVVLFQDTA